MGISVYSSYYSDEMEVRLEPTKVHPYDVFGSKLEQILDLKTTIEDVAANFKRFEDPVGSGFTARGAYEKCIFDLMMMAHKVALLPGELCRKEQRSVAGLLDIVEKFQAGEGQSSMSVDDILALHPSFLHASRGAYMQVLAYLEDKIGIRSDEFLIDLEGM